MTVTVRHLYRRNLGTNLRFRALVNTFRFLSSCNWILTLKKVFKVFSWTPILNNVLLTVALASSADSTPGELVLIAQSFHVHDTVFGEFLPRKTPLYNLYDSFHCCRYSHMLQWNWKLLVPPGV